MLLFILRWGVFCTLHPCCRYPYGLVTEFCLPLPYFSNCNYNLHIMILVYDKAVLMVILHLCCNKQLIVILIIADCIVKRYNKKQS